MEQLKFVAGPHLRIEMWGTQQTQIPLGNDKRRGLATAQMGTKSKRRLRFHSG